VKLLLDVHKRALLNNWRWNAERREATTDFKPVVKLFVPWSHGTWLLTEMDPEDQDTCFGLCDPGLGTPELGNVSLAEMMEVRGPGGLTIERDRHFTARKTLSEYTAEARERGFLRA
jgi:hypothetical protein